jgi:hypothetical protein
MDTCKACGEKGRYTGIVRRVRDMVFGKLMCPNNHISWKPSGEVVD